MTDEHTDSGDDSRRSFMKKGALAAGGLALGASGSAAAQTPADGGGAAPTAVGEVGEAIVQVSSFYPRARFTFVSGVVDWSPDVPEVTDDIWDSYDTYMIRWLNTNEIVPLWVEQDAEIGEFDDDLGFIPDDEDPNQPQLYEMDEEWELFDEGDDLVEVTISAVPEEDENDVLDTDEWWQDDEDGGGTATETTTDSSS